MSVEDVKAAMRALSTQAPSPKKMVLTPDENEKLYQAGSAERTRMAKEATQYVKAEKDRNARATKEAQLKKARASLATMATSASSVGAVDQWILDGLKTWIDTFLPGIINLRLYPSFDHPDEQFFGHLKREHFEDRDQTNGSQLAQEWMDGKHHCV